MPGGMKRKIESELEKKIENYSTRGRKSKKLSKIKTNMCRGFGVRKLDGKLEKFRKV